MEIEIFNNQPIIQFTLFDKSNNPLKCDFLVDTWFMESVVLIVDKKNSALLKIIEVFNFEEVPENKWIMVWNWQKVKTFSWKIKANFFWKKENINVLIVQWEKDDMPIIWIEFLKQNQKKLNLDFDKNIFELF